jgi:superfamily II DNA or RNA helicase
LNETEKPTLLFAPGVKESLWFAEQLTKEGIPSAHIDGNDVWLKGSFYRSDQEARDELRRMAESGDVKIICNRFVLREGIDWPFIEHMIFATIFGALTSYLQSGGRGLRAHHGKPFVTVQDHGGNWWRHGSLNSDREWSLDTTDYMVSEAREERLRKRKEPEPICCPKCFGLRLSGPQCPFCKFIHHERSRMVVQLDGSLKEMHGNIFRVRRIDGRQDIVKHWTKYYYRGRNADMTFNQVRGLYAYENNWKWPPDGLPFMPKEELDWFRHVSEVPVDRLVSNG